MRFVGFSTIASHTHSGPSTTSSSVISATSEAGRRRAPIVRNARPSPICPTPSRASRRTSCCVVTAPRLAARCPIEAFPARDPGHHALRAEIEALAVAMPNLALVNFYEDPQGADALAGRMDVARLPAWPHEAAEVYLCGPHKFMQAQWVALINAGVPVARLHREVFGPELLDHLL